MSPSTSLAPSCARSWRAAAMAKGNGPDPLNAYPGNRRELQTITFVDMQPNLTTRGLIKDILQQEQISLIIGAKQCGKTFFTLDMDLHIASGREYWFGHRLTACPVIYIATE